MKILASGLDLKTDILDVINTNHSVLLVLNHEGKLGFLDPLITDKLSMISDSSFDCIVFVAHSESLDLESYMGFFEVQSFPFYGTFIDGVLKETGGCLNSLIAFLKGIIHGESEK